MNRRRALYQYEIGTMKWFFVAGILGGLLVLFVLNGYLDQIHQTSQNMVGDIMSISSISMGKTDSFTGVLIEGLERITPIILIGISFMVMFQFADYHKRNRREYIVSLPFSQRERFVAKLIIGSSIITIACAVFCIGVLVLRQTYYVDFVKVRLLYPQYNIFCANDTLFQTLRTILLLWITALTAYAVFTAIHTLITVGILASLVSIGVVATPVYVLGMCYLYREMFWPNAVMTGVSLFYGPIRQICQAFMGMGYYEDTVEITFGYAGNDMARNCIDYGAVSSVFVTLIIVLVACVVFGLAMNVKQDGAKFGTMIPNARARVFFSAGIAVCFSFPIANLIAFILGISQVFPAVISLQIIVIAVLFLLNQKIFKRVIR